MTEADPTRKLWHDLRNCVNALMLSMQLLHILPPGEFDERIQTVDGMIETLDGCITQLDEYIGADEPH